MFTIRSLSSGDYLYKDGKRVPWMPSPNFNKGFNADPKFLVMHFTAGSGYKGSVDWLTRSAAKASAHLVIGRDGSVVQLVSFSDRSWHAGKSRWRAADGKTYKGLNHSSIGIELANAGACQETAAGTWKNDLGVRVDGDDIVVAQHRNGPVWFEGKKPGLVKGNVTSPGWEIYPEPQMRASREIAALLVERYGLDEVLGHDDISPGRKNDPGPAFNMASFKAAIDGRDSDDDDLFKVRPGTPGGLSIRKGPDKSHDKVQEDNLPVGTELEFIEADGRWWFVSVLDDNGDAVTDGWVHSHYVVAA